MQRHIHIGIAEMCVRKRVLIEIPLRYALKSVSRELKKSVSDIFSNQGLNLHTVLLLHKLLHLVHFLNMFCDACEHLFNTE